MARRDTKPGEPYPYRVYPAQVCLGPDGTPEPPFDLTWSETQGLRWHLGLVSQLVSPLTLELTQERPSGGRYALRIGSRPPITRLSAQRTWDILGGVLEAVVALGDLT